MAERKSDARLDTIRLLVLDVDGVLTDGTLLLGCGEEECKSFHTRDGAGLALWRDAGYATTLLTGRGGAAVRRRAAELRIDPIWEHVTNKAVALQQILTHFGLHAEQVAAMGDDLPDLGLLAGAGFSACPADASPDVRRRVDFVAPSPGGRGAVRDLVEHVLRSRGEWDRLVSALV